MAEHAETASLNPIFYMIQKIDTYPDRLHHNTMKLILIAIISMLSVPGLALAVELPPLERGEIEYPNMDSRLTHIYNSADQHAVAASTNSMEDRIRVVLVMEYPDAPIPENLGIEVEISYEELVQVVIPVGNLAKIADDENVRLVRMPSIPVPSPHTTGMTVSKGANTMSSIQVNHAGYTGKGVNVAVIDSGFDMSNPEISANIAGYKSFDHDYGIRGDGIKHGTASTEIVVDVAPDVNLYLYNVRGDVGFLNLIDHIMDREDIDIITMSLSWRNSVGPADGTSRISQKVDEARDNGILFVTSAGNYANSHWQGKFQDTDDDQWHNFDRRNETISMNVNPDEELKIVLSWWDSPSLDFDLYLYDENLNRLESSRNNQPFFSPFEVITYTPFYDREVSAAIKSYNGFRTADLQLFSNYNFKEYAVKESSISIPADAKGSLSVGAVDWRYDRLEGYSSQGPTSDGRIKPDLTGPTCVETTSYNHDYCGTSASAPHVAGAAALIMEKYPDATADQVQGILESTVYERHPKSNLDGTGRADVSMLVGADILALDNGNPECASLNSCFFPETVSIMPGDTVTWVNTDTLPIIIQGSNGSVSFESGTLLRGERYSMAFQQGGTFGYTDGRNTWASGQIMVDPGATPMSSIRGTVFSDDNGNGTLDEGERGIQTILTLATESASTDAMGKYSFTGVTPGTHTIQVTVPAGFVLPAGESTSKTVTVVGGDAGTVNFALQPAPMLPDNVTLNILAFDDDGDGIREAGEAPLPGIIILTYVPASGLTDVLITGADGTASKSDLLPSSFYAIALPPEGMMATSHPLSFGDSTHYGVLDVKNPAPGSTHFMNLGIKQDPCTLFPPEHFAAALLRCPET